MMFTLDCAVDTQAVPLYTAPMTTPLDLPNWTVLSVDDSVDRYDITARYDIGTSVCSSCKHEGKLYRFGLRRQSFFDLPRDTKQVRIHVERQRYRCTNCGHTMMQALPDMDQRRHMTRRLIAYIREAGLKHTLVAVAQECGLDKRSVWNVVQEYVH